MPESHNKRIRILQLGSPTGLYGAERWILALIKHLDREQVDSWVASIKDEPGLEVSLCQEAKKLGFHTHIFEAYGKANFSAVKQLRDFILENKINILHTHGYKTDLIGLLAIKGTSCRIITTPHGWTQNPDLKLRCYETIDRFIFPFFDGVAPLSQELYDALASSIWHNRLCKLTSPRIPKSSNPQINDLTNLFLIKNGVDISEIDDNDYMNEQIVALRERGCFIIGYIGRLVHGKGLDILLRALAKLKSVAWQLVVIGEGEQRQELKDLAQSLGKRDSVHFWGFREDRISFLKGFDLFVLPSRSEGTPRCLMEAMAAKVPAIASDIPGCRVLIEHGKTGMLFPVDNATLLAKRIEEIAVNKVLRDSFSRAAREFVEQHFSAERMAKEYTNLYFSIIRS